MSAPTEPTPASPLRVPPAELVHLTPDAWTEPFWAAAAEHRLVVPRCTACGSYRFPPGPFCWSCQAQDVDWVERPPRGRLYSYTVVRHPVLPQLADCVPYAPGVVELPDTGGVRVVGDLVEVAPEDIRIGMDLDLVWRDVREGVAVPTFRPAAR